MKTFTVHLESEDKVFYGFNKRYDTIDYALAFVEGEIEVWSVDDQFTMNELSEYYAYMGFENVEIKYVREI